jgi:hypothetical protein
MAREEAGGELAMAGNFTVLPNGLYDAFADGELTPSMFLAMTFLHRWANWSSGVVRKMRAGRMENATNGVYSASTFQEALRDLKRAGRIADDHVQGSRSWYAITINNFTVLSGPLKDQVINPSEIKDWRRSRASRAAENQSESGVNAGRGRAEAVTVLEVSLEFKKNSDQSLSLSSSLPPSLSAEAEDSAEQRDTQKPKAELDPFLESQRSTEKQYYIDLQSNEGNMRTLSARATAVSVLRELFGQPYTPFHEEGSLPRFLQYFNPSNCEDDLCEELHHSIMAFVTWVKARPKLAQKFLSLNDFWFHFLNESGRPNGLRPQFEAFTRSITEKVESSEAERAEQLKYLEGETDFFDEAGEMDTVTAIRADELD